jgi:hypothetical protein
MLPAELLTDQCHQDMMQRVADLTASLPGRLLGNLLPCLTLS